ncbi:PKD domain-containing protein [Alteromonas gilva]|uniref:S41 family peptidase n=1 Tax=Alteromonas gilva TaxID=2987522 RepID=A0ABT5KXX1_9ALTE|nr:S41 family peptidase [Alteromonas gilva]MDC8829624.1 S41 family peptidase [Alteromonas gilva]
MQVSKWSPMLTVALAVSFLTACGGGGGGGSTTPRVNNPPPANVAPVANAGSDQSVDELTLVTLSGSGTDSDGSISSYAWSQLAGTAVTLSDVNTQSVSFDAPDVSADEVLTFQLTVTDNDGDSGTDVVAITVRDITPPSGPVEPTWVAGVYEPQADYIARCEVPRTGIDPFSGQPYPDEEGTAMDEKLWLRSWTNDTYLWYDEVDDNDPANYSVLGYFDQLKTNALTPTGTPKDNFHFSQATDEYNELTQTGVSSGYGIKWEFVRSAPPRELIVRYTEPDSPASLAGIPRGASVKRVNGVDFVDGGTQAQVDILNDGLFPAENGTTASFVFERVDGTELAVDLTSADVAVVPVQNVRVFDTAAGKTGYFQFNTFIRTAQDGLINTVEQFVDENVTELVIDLRYNGGGLLALASQLSYMVAGPSQTNNAIFETLQFNDKNPDYDPVTGRAIRPTPFYGNVIDYNAGVLTSEVLPSLSLTRIYVLTTDNTCSASEAVMNSLRGIDVEVVQIGGSTCGKPYGFYPTDNCGTTYFTIQFQGVNNKGFGDYADGFIPTSSPNFDFELPGCDVADDFSAPLGDPNEGMLSAALAYAETGACPVTASSSTTSTNAVAASQYAESNLSIKRPEALRNALILHNKINEPIIRETQQ